MGIKEKETLLQSNSISALTGATISSKAVTKAIYGKTESIINHYKAEVQDSVKTVQEPANTEAKDG